MDAERFDAAMASLDPGMVVVTAAAGDERSGCLVGFHSQSSIHPRKYAVWLSRANRTFRVALLSEHLAVHFLTAADRDLAELFGAMTGDDVDKFAACSWSPSPEGLPLLDRCPNRIVLRRSAVLDEGGDHVCFVGDPVSAESAGSFEPLRLGVVRDVDAGHDVDDRPV